MSTCDIEIVFENYQRWYLDNVAISEVLDILNGKQPELDGVVWTKHTTQQVQHIICYPNK